MSCIGKKTDHNISGTNFFFKSEKMEVWHTIKVCSSKKSKIYKFWENCRNFSWHVKIL